MEISTAFLNHACQRINVTVPRYALGIIDKAAKTRGMSRSAFLFEAALHQAQA